MKIKSPNKMEVISYRSYPTIKVMVRDLMTVWDLEDNKKMYHGYSDYPLLEDCLKPVLEVLWDKFVNNEVK